MRIFIFATHHGDYSVELATALARRSRVALFLDERQKENDCGAAQIDAFSRIGTLRVFSKRIKHRLSLIITLVGFLIQFRPEMFIAHAHYDRYTLFLHYLISRFCPLYLIVHDPAPHSGRDAALSARANRLDRWGRDLATAFIVHGAFCAGQLEATGIVRGRPVLSAPHGPILRPDQHLTPSTPPMVLMFGRMEAYKGLDVLLTACERLAARGSAAKVKLMGNGEELARRRVAFEAVGAEVVCQFIPRDIAVRALQDASVVVAPYTEATQSGVVAAAFAAGRPIVASAVGGLVDFIRHQENGLLVPPRDPDALAEAIERLVEDQGFWSRLAEGAAETARTQASWDRFADVILANPPIGRDQRI